MFRYTGSVNTILFLLFFSFTLFAADTIPDAATPQPITFLPIDKKKFAKVTAYLSEQNQNLPQGTILSMGFEPDAENSWKKNLVIISLTSDNNPVKQSYEVDERFFTSLTQPAVTIGEQPSKVTGETTSFTPDSTRQQDLFAGNIKPDRTAEDLLFQVQLDWGVDLALPITKENIAGLEVFFVDGNALAARFVFNGEVTEDFCKELAKREPLRVVFRDEGFASDSVKINVEQIFKLMSPRTEVKTV